MFVGDNQRPPFSPMTLEDPFRLALYDQAAAGCHEPKDSRNRPPRTGASAQQHCHRAKLGERLGAPRSRRHPKHTGHRAGIARPGSGGGRQGLPQAVPSASRGRFHNRSDLPAATSRLDPGLYGSAPSSALTQKHRRRTRTGPATSNKKLLSRLKRNTRVSTL